MCVMNEFWCFLGTLSTIWNNYNVNRYNPEGADGTPSNEQIQIQIKFNCGLTQKLNSRLPLGAQQRAN